jgi:hypothetical protein
MSETSKKLYSKEDLAKARIAMLKELAAISGGELLRGCCTQGCCRQDAQSFSAGFSSDDIDSYRSSHH